MVCQSESSDTGRGVYAGRRAMEDLDVVDRYLRAMDETAGTVEPAEKAALEARFIEAAPRFASRYAISVGAWTDVGLTIDLIQRAGLDR